MDQKEAIVRKINIFRPLQRLSNETLNLSKLLCNDALDCSGWGHCKLNSHFEKFCVCHPNFIGEKCDVLNIRAPKVTIQLTEDNQESINIVGEIAIGIGAGFGIVIVVAIVAIFFYQCYYKPKHIARKGSSAQQSLQTRYRRNADNSMHEVVQDEQAATQQEDAMEELQERVDVSQMKPLLQFQRKFYKETPV